MAIQIQFRNDTAANWTSANPTLLAGEIGYETDTNKMKIGNGSTAWTSLAYSPVIATAAITSGTISGTTINSSSIGATTPSSGAFTSLSATGTTTLAAGTVSAPPLDFVVGTTTTTAVAGAVEYDGSVFYSSVAASTRGTVPSEQYVVLNTAYTLTAQTAAQQLFNNTASGAVTLPVGTYQFECYYTLSSMSATSGSFGFALGGTTTNTQRWVSYGNKSTNLTAAANTLITTNTGANTTLVTVSTATLGSMLIKGILNITVAGTIIPQVSLGVAAAAVVGVGSYFKVSPISGTKSTTNVTVGNWS